MDKLEYLEYDLAARIFTGDKLHDYGDGRWITVGKRDGEKNIEGKGTHIFVKGKGLNARIVKGPAVTKGKKMKNLLAGKISNTKGNKGKLKNPNAFTPKSGILNRNDFYGSLDIGTKISSRNKKDRSYFVKKGDNSWTKYMWSSAKGKHILAGVGLPDSYMAGRGFNTKQYKFTKGLENPKKTKSNPKYRDVPVTKSTLADFWFISHLGNGTIIEGDNGKIYEKVLGFWQEKINGGYGDPIGSMEFSEIGLGPSSKLKVLEKPNKMVPKLVGNQKNKDYQKIERDQTGMVDPDFFKGLPSGSKVPDIYGNCMVKTDEGWRREGPDGGPLPGSNISDETMSKLNYDFLTVVYVPKNLPPLAPKNTPKSPNVNPVKSVFSNSDIGSKPLTNIGNGKHHPSLLELSKSKIEFKPFEKHKKVLTQEEIINRVAGGDLTSGSCASLALAFAANLHGYNILDFRGGDSEDYFSKKMHIKSMYTDYSQDPPVEYVKEFEYKGAHNNVQHAWDGMRSTMVEGKIYHLSYAQHSSIVRRVGNDFEYLELQDPHDNGWKPLTKKTLHSRFSNPWTAYTLKTTARIYDVNDLAKCPLSLNAFGYINTEENKQKKGGGGFIK